MGLNYKRILLKVSGEALAGESKCGIDPEIINFVSLEIKSVVSEGAEIAVVIGGGNIFRGFGSSSKDLGIERTQGDYMGMLATVINALALQASLEDNGVISRVQTAIAMQQVAEPYTPKGIAPFRKKKSGDFCGWNRQSLLYYRYGGIVEGNGNSCRRYIKSYKNRRRIYGRSFN